MKAHACREDSSLCNELDEHTRNALDFHSMEGLKHKNDPMLGVLERGEVKEIGSSRAKRSRCVYSHGKENSLKNLELPSFSFEEVNTYLKLVYSAEYTTSESTECDSSPSNLQGVNSTDQDFKSSGVSTGKIMKLKGGVKVKTHNENQSITVAYLDLDDEKLSQSALVDVDLTVQATHRTENVPFVCLTSESYGKAILGYPLGIGVLPSKESVASRLFGDEKSRLRRLVWRTSKRTPVCYVANTLPSVVTKNVQDTQASENTEESTDLPAREKGVLIEEKSLMRTVKCLNQGKTALRQTCVPVEGIFRKISSINANMTSFPTRPQKNQSLSEVSAIKAIEIKPTSC